MFLAANFNQTLKSICEHNNVSLGRLCVQNTLLSSLFPGFLLVNRVSALREWNFRDTFFSLLFHFPSRLYFFLYFFFSLFFTENYTNGMQKLLAVIFTNYKWGRTTQHTTLAQPPDSRCFFSSFRFGAANTFIQSPCLNEYDSLQCYVFYLCLYIRNFHNASIKFVPSPMRKENVWSFSSCSKQFPFALSLFSTLVLAPRLLFNSRVENCINGKSM